MQRRRDFYPVIPLDFNHAVFDRPASTARLFEVFRQGCGVASAQDMGVPFLGRIPLDPDVVTQSDAGEPFAMFYSDTPTAEAYHEIANKVEAFCKKSGSLVNVAPRRH